MTENIYLTEELEKKKREENLTPHEKEIAQGKEIEEIEDYAEDEEAGRERAEREWDERQREDIAKSEFAKDMAKDKSSGWWTTYARNLCDYGEYLLRKIEYPAGWAVVITPTDGTPINIFGRTYETQQGVIIFLRSSDGMIFQRGMLTTMDPDYDIHAIETLVVQTENTIDSAMGLLESDKNKGGTNRKSYKDKGGTVTESGIYLGK